MSRTQVSAQQLLRRSSGEVVIRKTSADNAAIVRAWLRRCHHGAAAYYHPLMRLLDLPNFILTPHVAWVRSAAVQSLVYQLIDNVEAF